MEVINTTEFQPTEFLIGQQSKTLSHGVSNDPALMAMLSTGFYGNPMRTMIQEMLFNAWDAHKLNNNTGTPIDVYINETSGLIIRDYGPGIEPGEGDTNIHGVYCIYGYSSKRGIKAATGGFGLGSKSPFSYTDSFTITSFYEGTKNMYLIRRVAEDQDGKPGMTPLMKVPSEEHGMMIVIPLKTGHMSKAYDHIKNLVKLSGLKINLHYQDEPVEEIREETLVGGEFSVLEENNSRGSRVVAVFGGVRYNIPNDEYYSDELEFLNQFVGDRNTMYVGFHPNSLTPLPNREGLNINEKSKEAIKAALETYIERFQALVTPLTKSMLQVAVELIAERTKDPLYGLYRCLLIGAPDTNRLIPEDRMQALMTINAPEDPIDRNIWMLASRMLNRSTSHQNLALPRHLWYREIFKNFIYCYPSSITLLRAIDYLGDRWKAHSRHSRSDIKRVFVKAFKENVIQDLIRTEYEWSKISEFPMGFRFVSDSSWEMVSFRRPHHPKDRWQIKVTGDKIRKTGRLHRPMTGKHIYVKQWRSQEYQIFEDDDFIVPKVIYLAKTLKTLDDMSMTMVSRVHDVEHSSYNGYGHLLCNNSIPGVVIHDRKGEYEKAVQFFESRGYTVYQAEEPIRNVTKVVKIKKPEGFIVLPERYSLWAGAPKDPKAQYITDPEVYYYEKMSSIVDGGSYRPASELLTWFKKKHPKTVIVYNATQERILKDKGVKHLDEVLLADLKTHFNDAKYFALLALVGVLWETFLLPHKMLEYPIMQKEFGVVIPKGKTLKEVLADVALMQTVKGNDYNPLKPFRIWLTDNFKYLGANTMALREKHQEFQLFNLDRIRDKFSETPEADQEAFLKKVLKTIKSF